MRGINCIGIIGAGVIMLTVAAAGATDQIKIKGVVTRDFQIVDSGGRSYDVAESDAADDMLTHASGRNVEVTGTLEESAGIRTITVEAFKVLDK